MAITVIMPKQGQSVESCIITELKKKKGDVVKKGDVLFSYETDKASFEEVSPAEGVVLACFYNEGDEVPVLENMMVIGQPGEDISSLPGEQPSPPSNHQAETDTAPPCSQSGGAEQIKKYATNPISPRAKKLAEDSMVDISQITGSGPGGRIIEKDILQILNNNRKMTPLAKKLAAEQGMSQQPIGTGLGGRIRASDMSASAHAFGGKVTASDMSDSEITVSGKGTVSASPAPINAGGNDYEERKISNIRKIIARSMHASLQNSAQLTHHLGADARNILAFRKKVKKMLEEGLLDTNITLNDMVCIAVIRALKKFPNVNTHFLGDSIRYFNKIHLGLAVDTDRGLMVPVVRNADDLSITGLARQLKEIAAACKSGSANPDLLSPEAGTFTVSNLGNYGVEMFTPVINLPQSAILGVNTIVPRPKDLGNGVYAFVPFIGLSLTYDHRSLDGGEATRFLKQIAIEIENLEPEL